MYWDASVRPVAKGEWEHHDDVLEKSEVPIDNDGTRITFIVTKSYWLPYWKKNVYGKLTILKSWYFDTVNVVFSFTKIQFR